MQEKFDSLYHRSALGHNFKSLYETIISRENILLAYRNIKKNKGSKTKGSNNETIIEMGEKDTEKLVNYIRKELENYKPEAVRRVFIPKANGKTRALGIPTIRDRLIQQCILQVLDPICEAKFHKHSYGFRPNRNTIHAVARATFLINQNKLNYCVDIDIKGFFDNVNHGKLLKQIYSLGIRDKKVLSIISKILKSEIVGEGIPCKGTPQGGIISPLLSNIVLNELDWWLSDQWLTFKTEKEYASDKTKQKATKRTKLKEIFHVRYADDFKIFCRDYNTAQRIYIATQKWLKERLGLDISESKFKVINLRTNYSEFLGFKLKAVKKGNKYVCISHMNDKSVVKVKQNIKNQIKVLQCNRNRYEVNKLNAIILGAHQYYKYATRASIDFNSINKDLYRFIRMRTQNVKSKVGFKSKAYDNFYGKYNYKDINLLGVTMYPIAGVKTFAPLSFTQSICNYTEIGRKLIHDNLTYVDMGILRYLLRYPIKNKTTEYNDNRISLYVGQQGKCSITKQKLEIGDMHCHHIKPKWLGGDDKYNNLIFITDKAHKLIHATKQETIENYLTELNLDKSQIEDVNKLRAKIGIELLEM